MPPQYGAYPLVAPAKKNTGLIVGLVVGAVVIVGGGIGAYAALGSPVSALVTNSAGTDAASTKITVSLPSTAGGMELLTSANAQAEVARVRSGVEAGGAVYQNALFGAYGPKADGGYQLVLVDQSVSDIPAADQSEFASSTPDELVRSLASYLKLSDAQVETSTDPGAALTCGVISASGLKFPICVWEDSETFGFAYFFTTYFSTGIPAAAQYTDALRAAAERS